MTDEDSVPQHVPDKVYALAPNNLGPSLKRYIEGGVPLGGFMTAVMANDLMEAVGRADEVNIGILNEICSWVYSYAPRGCHGSYDAVGNWKPKGEKQ